MLLNQSLNSITPVAAATFLVYDVCITLDQEVSFLFVLRIMSLTSFQVKYIWRYRWLLPKTCTNHLITPQYPILSCPNIVYHFKILRTSCAHVSFPNRAPDRSATYQRCVCRLTIAGMYGKPWIRTSLFNEVFSWHSRKSSCGGQSSF